MTLSSQRRYKLIASCEETGDRHEKEVEIEPEKLFVEERLFTREISSGRSFHWIIKHEEI